MQAAQTVAPKGVVPYYFLLDYQIYSGEDGKRPGDIAGLKVDVGDRLAATTLTETKSDRSGVRTSAICRRATVADFARKREYATASSSRKTVLVAVEFDQGFSVDGRSYRGPTPDKKADIAGFPEKLARKLCEGYLNGSGGKVGAVAHYFIETVDTDLKAPAEDPAKPAQKRRRRHKASPDTKGAPEQKGK